MHAEVPKNQHFNEIFKSETQFKSQVQKNKTSPTNEESFNSVSPDNRNIHKNDTKLLKCNIDNKKFKKQCYLVYHPEKHHSHNLNGQYTCDICKKTLSSYRSLRRHVESVHTHVKYKCQICQKLYSDQSSLIRHRRKCFLE